MAVAESMAFSEQDLNLEMQDLRQSLLPIFLPLLPILTWVWYYYVVYERPELGINLIPVPLVTVTTLLVWWLRRKQYYRLASWLFLLNLVFVNSLMILIQVSTLTFAFGLLITIMANALLGPAESWVLTTLALIGGVFAHPVVPGDSPFSREIIDVVVLYYLVWGTLWLATRPLRRSVESALLGWSQAHEAVLELRQRRGELYRVVRALEEATGRLEHTNNELIMAQQEAETARDLKTRLAATVSHELRGPLNLILGFSKLMALSPESYGEPLPKIYHADMFTIYRNSQHLLALINDVLDLSKIEARRLSLVKDRTDFNEDVIQKTLSGVLPLTERKSLALRQEIEGNLPWILADQVRLRQALLNLLTNAIRFTESGSITVRAVRQEQQLLVSVQDTGPGIAEQDMAELFKEFHQLQTTRRREEGGTGLGLSITKHLIELHGGHIWAESKRGVGSTFYFTLPLPDAPLVLVGSPVTTAGRQRPQAPESCLVVHEDHRVVRLLARYVDGHHIMGTPNAGEVPALIKELHPKAIIADARIAPEVAREMSAAQNGVPLIGCDMPHLDNAHLFRNVLCYLLKPVVSDMVLDVMRRVERNGETTVLLVDDEPDTLRLIERILTALPRPYHILRAYDGVQALERMRETLPDIVFLDMMMPRMDGQEVLSQMQNDEALCDVPVVIVSAQDWLEDNSYWGTDIYLHKRQPMSVGQATGAIRALLESLGPERGPEPEKPQSS